MVLGESKLRRNYAEVLHYLKDFREILHASLEKLLRLHGGIAVSYGLKNATMIVR